MNHSSDLRKNHQSSLLRLVAGGAFVLGVCWLLAVRSEFFLLNAGNMWRASSATYDYPPASEFHRSLSCYSPVGCVRNGSAFVGEALVSLYRAAVRLTPKLPEHAANEVGALLAGLTIRGLALFALPWIMLPFGWSSTRRLSAAAVLVYMLSGTPQLLIGRLVAAALPLPTRLEDRFQYAINDVFHDMKFVFYDYVFIASSCAICSLVSPHAAQRLLRFPRTVLILIGLGLASLFEILPTIFLVCLSCSAIRHKDPNDRANDARAQAYALGSCVLFVALGQTIWTSAVAWYWQRASPPTVSLTGDIRMNYLSSISDVLGLGVRSSFDLDKAMNFGFQNALIGLSAIGVGALVEWIFTRGSRVTSQQQESWAYSALTAFGLVMMIVGVANSVLLATAAEVGRHSIPTVIGGLCVGICLAQSVPSRSTRSKSIP